jgi:hypothetical protein
MINKIITIWLKDKIQLTIWLPICLLISWNWLLLDSKYRLFQGIAQIPTSILARIMLSLLLLCIGLAASLITLHICKKSRHYRFDEASGIHFHKKTNKPFCTSCLISNIESPLLEKDSGWRCQRKDCGMKYPNPKYQRPLSDRQSPTSAGY